MKIFGNIQGDGRYSWDILNAILSHLYHLNH